METVLTSGQRELLSMPLDDRPGEKNPSESHPYNLRKAIERFERGFLSNILELTCWNRCKAAQMLGIKRNTLETKIRDYHITPGTKPSRKPDGK